MEIRKGNPSLETFNSILIFESTHENDPGGDGGFQIRNM